MTATLRETLLVPEVQPQVVTDCESLVNGEVSGMSGVSGTAVKLGGRGEAAMNALRSLEFWRYHRLIRCLTGSLWWL